MAKPVAPARRRRWRWIAVLVVIGWVLAGHYLARPLLRDWIDEHFEGRCSIVTAVIWPTLDVTGFGVRVEAPGHVLAASRVGVDFRLLGLFGGRLVDEVDIAAIDAEFDAAAPVELFRSAGETAEPRPARAGEDPGRLPPILFSDPRIALRDGASVQELIEARRAELTQVGERRYRLECEPGTLAGIPFERLSAHMHPRAGHLIVGEFKLNAFRGMIGGMLDVDTAHAGGFNGELEWHFLEVERVWERYGLPYREKRRGDLSGRMVFEADRPHLSAVRGTGNLQLERGEFYSPISFKMFLLLGIPSLEEARLTRGDLQFSFEKELVWIEECKVFGRAFEWEAQGILSFDGRADLEIRHGGTTVAMSGPLEEPSVRVLPLDAITAPFDRIFRKRIEEK